MADDWYKHDLDYMVELLDEVNGFKAKLTVAKSDIERLDAMEKLIAYAASLSHAATWAMYKIRHPS